MTDRSQLLFPGSTMKWYLAQEALSSSALKQARVSAGHYLAALNGPRYMTDAQRIGQAFHTNLLEPEKFLKEFPIFRGKGDKRKLAKNGGCKEAWDEAKQKALELGYLSDSVLGREDLFNIFRGVRAVERHPRAGQLLEGAAAVECSIVWHDEEYDMLCKARPDLIHRKRIMMDFKKCQDASPSAFARDAAKYGYPNQAFHHLRGVKAAQRAGELDGMVEPGDDWLSIIVAVEEKPNVWNPRLERMDHAVAVYEIEGIDLHRAGEQNLRAIQTIKAIGDFDPADTYSNDIETLALPDWWRNAQ